MTPEQLSETREIRTIQAFGPGDILFHEGGDALLRMTNERGPFEVLATADRAADFLSACAQEEELELRGFWRRRSGFRANGDRHFIWCLILLSWEGVQPTRLAA